MDKVVRIQGHEADDVVATLMEQAVQRGYRAVIASPDKDFKQLISENVQIVIPLADLRRWSFYTLKHYHAQYNCDPQSDLSFRKCTLLCFFFFCSVKPTKFGCSEYGVLLNRTIMGFGDRMYNG